MEGVKFIVDKWWKAILLLGIAFSLIALLRDVKIVNPGYLLGLGLGLCVVGFSQWIAQKTAVIPMFDLGGFFHGNATRHTPITLISSCLGWGITVLFLVLIIIGLVK